MKRFMLFALVLSLLFCIGGCEVKEQETLALTENISIAQEITKEKKTEEVQTIAETDSEPELQTVAEDTLLKAEKETAGEYIGNLNTKKFHHSSCSHLPYEKNRAYFTAREQATEQYYKPCQICNP